LDKKTFDQEEAIRESCRLDPGGTVTFVTFSPDGKTLAYGLAPFGVDGPGSKVEAATVLINVADGKEKLRIPADKSGWPNAGLFSPDGKLVAIGHSNGFVILYDPKTGQQVRALDVPSREAQFTFSPDGKLLAATIAVGNGRGSDDEIYLVDLETGKRIRHFGSPYGEVTQFSFSEDGKTVAAEHRFGVASERVNGLTTVSIKTSVHLWDTATGKDLGQIGSLVDWSGAAFAKPPCGERLREVGAISDEITISLSRLDYRTAWSQGSFRVSRCTNDAILLMPPQKVSGFWIGNREGSFALFRTGSGGEVVRFNAFQGGFVRSCALSQNATRLAACGTLPKHGGSTILLWDLTKLPETAPAKEIDAGAGQVAAWWEDLKGSDNPKAHQAMRRLIARRDKTIPMLRDKLRPAELPAGIREYLAQLDNDSLQTREKAMEQLKQVGPAARAELENALRNKPSGDKERRIKEIIESFPKDLQPDEVLALRAVYVLEAIGTDEAKAILAKLEEGAANAPLTRSAQAAMKRLKDTGPSKP
jgi:WD40 repeat protein